MAAANPAKAISIAGLTCGVMDITAALVIYGTMGAKPLRLAQGIAGGVLGPSTYCGGVPTALLGLLLHFVIALGAASVFFLAAARQRKRALGGIPKLSQRTAQEGPLLQGTLDHSYRLFPAQGVVQIAMNAFKLSRPRRQRIRFVRVEHIAHGQGERMEIVLDAQQLQRVLTVAVDGMSLQSADHFDLAQRVPGKDRDGQQRDREPDQ